MGDRWNITDDEPVAELAAPSESQIDRRRIRAITAERRARFRMRLWAAMIAIVAAIAWVGCAWRVARSPMRPLQRGVYCVAAIACGWTSLRAARRWRAVPADEPVEAPTRVAPQFDALSDGTQTARQLDAMTRGAHTDE